MLYIIANIFMKRKVNIFWLIKIQTGEILNRLISKGFLAARLSNYYLCTLHITLLYKLIKE